MHRSYNSYNPVASKLLQKRWDEKHFSDHRRHVVNVKPEVNADPPVTFMHLHLKLKKLQLEEERLATIERDNRILLEKMSHTMRNKGQLDNLNDAVPKSLSRGRREREMLRITRENLTLLKRINNKKPAISAEAHRRDWNRNLQFMDNISAFPEEWYLRQKEQQQRNDSTARKSQTAGSTSFESESDSLSSSRSKTAGQSSSEQSSPPQQQKQQPKAVTPRAKTVTPVRSASPAPAQKSESRAKSRESVSKSRTSSTRSSTTKKSATYSKSGTYNDDLEGAE